MEDNQIVELYWNRNENAISATEEKYGKYCRKIANNILKNDEDTQESINDTYLKLWNSIPPQRPNIFKAFIAKIVRNIALNKYETRNAKKRNKTMDLVFEEIEECIPSGNIEEEIEYKEIVNEINVFLSKLSSESRIYFLERYWYFQTIKDISIKYEQKESKIKMSLLRTRNSLKEHLEKGGNII